MRGSRRTSQVRDGSRQSYTRADASNPPCGLRRPCARQGARFIELLLTEVAGGTAVAIRCVSVWAAHVPWFSPLHPGVSMHVRPAAIRQCFVTGHRRVCWTGTKGHLSLSRSLEARTAGQIQRWLIGNGAWRTVGVRCWVLPCSLYVTHHPLRHRCGQSSPVTDLPSRGLGQQGDSAGAQDCDELAPRWRTTRTVRWWS